MKARHEAVRDRVIEKRTITTRDPLDANQNQPYYHQRSRSRSRGRTPPPNRSQNRSKERDDGKKVTFQNNGPNEERRCFRCNHPGHLVKECPYRDKPSGSKPYPNSNH